MGQIMNRRFYVYALVDPRDGSIFYVGKGTGKRYACHEREARRGKHINPFVAERIAEIHGVGLRVQSTILADKLTEADAFDRERVEIASRESLCNSAPGQRSHEERQRAWARGFIRRYRRFHEWVAEAPRSAEAIATYWQVLKTAAQIAARPQPAWVVASPGTLPPFLIHPEQSNATRR